MSNIPNTDECIAVYNTLKLKKTCRWILYRIETSNGQDVIVVDSTGERDKKWEDLCATLPANEPRFLVFDLDYEQNGMTLDKLLFISWAPDASKVKQRVMYSSCQRAFHSKLLGSRYIEAHDSDDLDINNIIAKI